MSKVVIDPAVLDDVARELNAYQGQIRALIGRAKGLQGRACRHRAAVPGPSRRSPTSVRGRPWSARPTTARSTSWSG